MKKAGPMPVWAWGGIGLAVAWLYAKYKANKASSSTAASTTGTTTSSAEPSTGAEPYYVIENNLPQTSTPITVNTGTSAPPVTTPVGTGPTPPTTQPPTLQGGNPPRGPHPPVPVGTPTPVTPKPPTAPAAQKYTVQKGDTLWGIAQKFYGNGAQYTNIWTYNLNAATRKAAGLPPVQGNNPNLIYPGETFLVPAKA